MMTSCQYPGCTNAVTGRRHKRYCSNAHKQAYYRMSLKAQQGKQSAASSEDLADALQRIDDLEVEVKRLHSLLDIERRLHADHMRRGFKAWLKKQPAASIGELGQKIQANASLPALSSRAGYAATAVRGSLDPQRRQSHRSRDRLEVQPFCEPL
jgi:hypothetical protein